MKTDGFTQLKQILREYEGKGYKRDEALSKLTYLSIDNSIDIICTEEQIEKIQMELRKW